MIVRGHIKAGLMFFRTVRAALNKCTWVDPLFEWREIKTCWVEHEFVFRGSPKTVDQLVSWAKQIES